MNRFEALWAGDFGNEYTERQSISIKNNIKFFGRTLKNTGFIRSLIEFGANTGENLKALRAIEPIFKLGGVEINECAFNQLKDVADSAIRANILNFRSKERWDITLVKGLLIHIHPDDINKAYSVLYEYSRRYILICEYFNPTPLALDYRGEKNAICKRDFAGEMLEQYPNLKCIDYGFRWSKDQYPQDDISWFLLEKSPLERFR